MKVLLTLIITLFLFGCSSSPKKDIETEKISNFSERAKIHFENIKKEKSLSKNSMTVKSKKSIKPQNTYSCTHHKKSSLTKKSPLITLNLFESDIREALIELSVITEIAIITDDSVEGLVSANLIKLPFDTALEIILAAGNYSYRTFDNYILVGSSTPDSPSFSQLANSCRYKPLYSLPIDLASSLSPYFQQFVNLPQHADYLTITAPQKIQSQIQQHIRAFDRQPGQVLLEMSIIEVSRQAMDILGVNWKQFGRDPNTQRQRLMGAGEWNGVKAVGADDILDAFTIGALPQRTLASSLQFLREEGQAELKAMPAIVSLDGREAQYSTTHSIWLPFSGDGNDGSRIRELEYGVDMKVVPRIANNGEITLKIVNASVSDLSQTDRGLPHVVSHHISSSVNIHNGDYLVLGGLLQTKRRTNNAGVPYAKDIPVAGYAFGQDNNSYEEMEVLIMIRPQILTQAEDLS